MNSILQARRALGDFGVPIAIVIMVLLNYIFKDAGVETLNVPAELTVSIRILYKSNLKPSFFPTVPNQTKDTGFC